MGNAEPARGRDAVTAGLGAYRQTFGEPEHGLVTSVRLYTDTGPLHTAG